MKNKQTHQTIIGIDLGDKKHSVCVLGKDGSALREFSLPNRSEDLTRFALDYPGALVAIETGTHSPWISRLLTEKGQEVLVANSRKLRAIYQNERKCDERDASMLAKIARLDRDLLHPVTHISEKSQSHLLSIKLRDSLVRSRVALINSLRGTLKSLGILLPAPSTAAFAKMARQIITDEQPALLPISKTGNVYLRSLLVQSAQYILGPFGPESDLRTHGLKLAARGGKAAKKKAVVAIARKLAVIMLAMWTKGSDYQAHKTPSPVTPELEAAA